MIKIWALIAVYLLPGGNLHDPSNALHFSAHELCKAYEKVLHETESRFEGTGIRMVDSNCVYVEYPVNKLEPLVPPVNEQGDFS